MYNLAIIINHIAHTILDVTTLTPISINYSLYTYNIVIYFRLHVRVSGFSEAQGIGCLNIFVNLMFSYRSKVVTLYY